MVSPFSPGLAPRTENETDLFWVLGAVNITEYGFPQVKQDLGLLDFLRLVEENDDSLEVPQAVWQYDSNRELFLRIYSEEDVLFDYHMEVKRAGKNKRPYIDYKDEYDMNQLWLISYGPDGSHTLRPWRDWGKQFCVEPDSVNKTEELRDSLREFDPVKLNRCRTAENKLIRQMWLFCGTDFDCEEIDVVPPEFTIEVECDESSRGSLSCDNDDDQENTSNGDAVLQGLWEDLRECRDDPIADKKFGQSLVYDITNNAADEFLALDLDSDCDDNGDDTETYLRVYEEKSSNSWSCVFVGLTNCTGGDGTIEATIGRSSDDFLVIVSSDGTDRDQRDFDLTLECTTSFPGDGDDFDLESGDSTDDLYCGDKRTADVSDDEDLPSDFDTKSEDKDCEVREDLPFYEEDNDDYFQDTGYIVDSKRINSDVTVETECNGDADDLQTLVRVYEIDEDEDGVNRYICQDSKILRCDTSNNDDRVFEARIGRDLPEEFRYLFVMTGEVTVEDCEEAFGCQ